MEIFVSYGILKAIDNSLCISIGRELKTSISISEAFISILLLLLE